MQVVADSTQLQQVFINLLVNAIKFSPGDGAIDVAMDCAGNDVEIRFIDHGDGIAPDMMPVIFERFRQADGSITRKHGGMGLGLAIARHIMDLHGGSVTAESAGLGQGATFTVRLPRLNEAAAMTRSDARQPAAPEASDGRLIGIHVLAVDDDANALGMLASMLELGGATVSKANSAAEAIEQFRRQSDIAVVLSDIGMPDRDGYDLIESLRRDFAERAERVAAVAITGYARDEDHARALHAGFDAHLAKPFGMDELFDAIVGLVRNRQSNAQASAPLRE